MQKYHEALTTIRCKIRAGENLTDEERALYQEWLLASGIDRYEYMTWENIELYMSLKANKPSWEEVFKQQQALSAAAPPAEHEVSLQADASPSQAVSGKTYRSISWKKWSIAAAVLFIVAAGSWYFFKQDRTYASAEDYLGINQTVLVLADNTIVPLTGLMRKEQFEQGRLMAQVSDPHAVTFTAAKGEGKGVVRVITGTGDSCRLRLPDGSLVTLNARSMVEIPLSYNNSLREINIIGEGYFTVSKRELPAGHLSPFKVNLSHSQVVVLGTSFNISSYANDSSSTIDLLTGSIQLINKGDTTTMEPGIKAVVDKKGRVHTSPLGEHVAAWRNNKFTFEDASLPQVMHTLERHYPVQVYWQGDFPNVRFDFTMKKPADIGEILQVLEKEEKAAVHFTRNGSKVYVSR